MSTRTGLALAGASAVITMLAACGSSHGAGAMSVPTAFGPSAIATSTQAAAAKAVAEQKVQACQPDSEGTSAWEVALVLRKSAREAFYRCEAIPPAKRQAAAACALSAAKAALKGTGAKAAREAGFVTALGKCL